MADGKDTTAADDAMAAAAAPSQTLGMREIKDICQSVAGRAQEVSRDWHVKNSPPPLLPTTSIVFISAKKESDGATIGVGLVRYDTAEIVTETRRYTVYVRADTCEPRVDGGLVARVRHLSDEGCWAAAILDNAFWACDDVGFAVYFLLAEFPGAGSGKPRCLGVIDLSGPLNAYSGNMPEDRAAALAEKFKVKVLRHSVAGLAVPLFPAPPSSPTAVPVLASMNVDEEREYAALVRDAETEGGPEAVPPLPAEYISVPPHLPPRVIQIPAARPPPPPQSLESRKRDRLSTPPNFQVKLLTAQQLRDAALSGTVQPELIAEAYRGDDIQRAFHYAITNNKPAFPAQPDIGQADLETHARRTLADIWVFGVYDRNKNARLGMSVAPVRKLVLLLPSRRDERNVNVVGNLLPTYRDGKVHPERIFNRENGASFAAQGPEFHKDESGRTSNFYMCGFQVIMFTMQKFDWVALVKIPEGSA